MGRIIFSKPVALGDEPGDGIQKYMRVLGAIKGTIPFIDPVFKGIWSAVNRPDSSPRKKAAAKKLIDGLTPEQKAKLDELKRQQEERSATRVGGLVTPLGVSPTIGPLRAPLVQPPRATPGDDRSLMLPRFDTSPLGGGRPSLVTPGALKLKPKAMVQPSTIIPTPAVPDLRIPASLRTSPTPPPKQDMFGDFPIGTPFMDAPEPEDRPVDVPAPPEEPPKRMFDVDVPVVKGSIDVGEFARRLREANLAKARALPEDLSQYSLAQLRAMRKLATNPEEIARLGQAARRRGKYELPPGIMEAMGGQTGAARGERYVLTDLPKPLTQLDIEKIQAQIMDLRAKGRHREAQTLLSRARAGLTGARTRLTMAKLRKLLASMRKGKGGASFWKWYQRNKDNLTVREIKIGDETIKWWSPSASVTGSKLLVAQKMAAKANRLANRKLTRKQLIDLQRKEKDSKAKRSKAKALSELKGLLEQSGLIPK